MGRISNPSYQFPFGAGLTTPPENHTASSPAKIANLELGGLRRPGKGNDTLRMEELSLLHEETHVQVGVVKMDLVPLVICQLAEHRVRGTMRIAFQAQPRPEVRPALLLSTSVRASSPWRIRAGT